MIIDNDKIIYIMETIRKRALKNIEDPTVHDVVKMMLNKNFIYEETIKEINLLEPKFITAFFIKYVDVKVDDEIREALKNKIDFDTIVKIKYMNDDFFRFEDLDKKSVKIKKSNIKCSLKKDIPLETMLNILF